MLTIIMIIVGVVVVGVSLYFIFFNPEYSERWKSEAPPQFQDMYTNFFSSVPDEAIFKNQLATAWKLATAVGGMGYEVKRVDNAYRDPAYNTLINGDKRSKHMEGKAMDFAIVQKLTPFAMEQLGHALNNQGLRVIFYPFGSSGDAIHIQQDARTPGNRRIYYATRTNTKVYKNTYREAASS